MLGSTFIGTELGRHFRGFCVLREVFISSSIREKNPLDPEHPAGLAAGAMTGMTNSEAWEQIGTRESPRIRCGQRLARW